MKNDFTNKKFGRLKVVSFSHYDKEKESNFWDCICDCGKHIKRSAKQLKASKIPSCGCYKVDRVKEKPLNTKHNLTKEPIYALWKNIRKRLKNKDTNYYKLNIKMCEQWENPVIFYNWCKNNGYKKGLQIDRIDTYGDYSPENCRFVTCKINQNNKTNNIYVFYKGEKISLKEASERSGINYGTLKSRYKKNKDSNIFLPVSEYRNRGI